MADFIDYLLKVSLGLVLVYLFYRLILSRHTFYTWNRWCLLMYSMLAFIIPIINISPAIQEAGEVPNAIVEAVPALPKIEDAVSIYRTSTSNLHKPLETKSLPSIEIWDIVFWIFLAGCLIRVAQICSQLYAFRRIKKRSELIYMKGVSVYHLKENILPFSFWKSIFLNQNAHSEEDKNRIIVHELAHVNQLHSLDILFAELLCTVCWFNPAVWLIRHAIRENLEYIADREVIQKGAGAKEYQYLLLKVSGNHMSGMVNYFTFSSLKKRILMMNKARSARIHLIKFGFVLPLICVLLVAFRNNEASFWSEFGGIGSKQPVIITGILRDSESGQPLRDYKMDILFNTVDFVVDSISLKFDKTERQMIASVRTDDDGFYYWVDTVASRIDIPNSQYAFELRGSEYEYGGNVWFQNESDNWQLFGEVTYLVKKSLKAGFHDWYNQDITSLVKRYVSKDEIKSNLIINSVAFVQEHELKMNFRSAYKNPSQIVTKFQNGYFDKKRDLIGYVGKMQFYIDGEEVTYDKANYNFRFRQPNLVNSNRIEIQERYATKMYYFTSDTNRDAPPSSIVKSKNVEWIDVSKFDMAVLDKDSFYLNGFWQVNGVGSNMRPERGEIKRIALLKGKLARYYNKNFEKLWWIETRPAEEVVGRPDFAKL